MRALDASEIVPYERGQAVRLNTQVSLALDRLVRDYVCGARKCGAMLGVRIETVDGKTCGVLHCMADWNHKGIRRPRRSPPPYGVAGNTRSER